MSTFAVVSMIAGLGVLAITLADILFAVFGTSTGAGPISGRIAKILWHVYLRLHRRGSRRSHSVLRAAGPVIMFTFILTWLAALILAWALLFPPEAFAKPEAAGLWDRLVFSTKTILGRGGNSPALKTTGSAWEVLHGFAGLSGVTMVTIALAYILPVRAAVVQKRTLAMTISTLGQTPRRMKALGARAPDGGSVELHLIALVPMVVRCVQNHRAYPIIHYFHSRDPHSSLARSVVALVRFLEDDHPEAPAIDASVTEPLARALTNLFDELMPLGLDEYVEEARQDDSALPPPAALAAYLIYDGWEDEDRANGEQ